MKIILLQDVKSLGKKDQIVEVNDGYARNALFPKKLAMEANAKNLNDFKLRKANEEKKAAENLEAAKAFAAELSEKQVTVTMKVGDNGRAFGSISTKEIAEEAKKQLGYDLDKKKMSLDVPVKELGTYQVNVKLHPQVTAQLKLVVKEA